MLDRCVPRCDNRRRLWCNCVFQTLMSAVLFLVCVTEENAPTLLVATSAPVHEATSPVQTALDVWVSLTHNHTFTCWLATKLHICSNSKYRFPLSPIFHCKVLSLFNLPSSLNSTHAPSPAWNYEHLGLGKSANGNNLKYERKKRVISVLPCAHV